MKRILNKKLLLQLVLVIALYAAMQLLISSGILSRQMTSLIVPCCYNIILAVSLCLVAGVLGELSLGHAGFMSIGAYAAAIFTTRSQLPDLLTLLIALMIGGVTAAVFGLLIGVPVLRLKGDYLAIVTLGFGEIIKSVFNFLQPVTGGAKGLSGLPILTNYKHFTVVFIITVCTVLIISNLVRSRHGRAFTAIRDNYIAAQASGIPVGRYKTLAFVIAAFFAGIAGVIYGHNVGILKPVNFDYNMSIEILVMVVLGGMGSIRGSIIAAIVLTVLPELLRGFADMRMLIYAIVLIAMMLFNNSKFKENLLEKRGLRQMRKMEKEVE